MSKKWYEYFVVTAPKDAGGEVTDTAPIRASDLVPDAGGDATFTAPLTPDADFTDIYGSAQIGTPAHGYTVAGRRTYTVRPGDTLTKIAATELKDINRWKEIWDLNRDRVANENLIYPRLVLLMPS